MLRAATTTIWSWWSSWSSPLPSVIGRTALPQGLASNADRGARGRGGDVSRGRGRIRGPIARSSDGTASGPSEPVRTPIRYLKCRDLASSDHSTHPQRARGAPRSDRMSSSFCRARGSEPHPSGFARAGEVSRARIERRECSSRFDMNSVEDGGRGMIEARLRHLDTLPTPRPSRSPPRRARLSAAALPDPRGARHCLRGPPRRHRRR